MPRASRVVMQGAFYGRRSPKANQFKKHFSGRRKRLGAPGRTCMLSGKTTKKVVRVAWSGHKAPRKVYPNLHWKKLWWEEEKKWVKLRVCASEIKKVDMEGLTKRANRAGLDLYAWCKNHWEPGSRQPLMLRRSQTVAGRNMKPLWYSGDYLKRLNKGAPLMEDWRDMNKMWRLNSKSDWRPSLLPMPDRDRMAYMSVPDKKPIISEMVPGPRKEKALADFLAKKQEDATKMAEKAKKQKKQT